MANLSEKAKYAWQKEMLKYMSTYLCESAVFAIDGSNAENVQTTGAVSAMIDGVPVTIEEDAEMDISASTTEVTLTAWATATAYTVGNIRESAEGGRYRCITAHTSSADDEPEVGYNWEAQWERAPHAATNAVGATVASGSSRWFFATAQTDGTIDLWLCGDAATDGSEVCKVPQYDHKLYCPIGFLHINSNTTFVLGTTALTTIGTFYQAVGPVYPHPDNMDKTG